MKYLYFVISILVFICCLFSCYPKNLLKEEDPALRVIADHAEKQRKRYNLDLVASGALRHREVEGFALHYFSHKKWKIEEVRSLFILSMEEFLNLANENEELQPLLQQHPISRKHVKFNIGFGTNDGEFHEFPYIAYAYLADDKIYYCYYDNLFGKFTDCEDVEESYEEALQIVMKQKQSNN